MTLRALAAALATAALASAGAGTAAAANGDRVHCTAGDAWCVAVFHKNDGRIHLDIAGFRVLGRYRLCVTPPRRREVCRRFKTHRQGNGAGASSVVFVRHFPHRRHGAYRARWIYRGRQLGHPLSFRV